MQWITLDSESQINEIIKASHEMPCLVFKHSTRCSISSMAKNRLDKKSDALTVPVKAYYLDLIRFRNISNALTEAFHVHHESPQILLIKNGLCVHDASHMDVSIREINEGLDAKVI